MKFSTHFRQLQAVSLVLTLACTITNMIQAKSKYHMDEAHLIKRLKSGLPPLHFILLNSSGNETQGGVATIEIRSVQPDKFVQHIHWPCQYYSKKLNNPTVWVDGFPQFEDDNFDGYLDMVFICNSGAHDITIEIWLYNQQTGKFYSNNTMVFNGIRQDFKRKVLIEKLYCCAGASQENNVYQFLIDRYVRVSTFSHECDDSEARPEPLCRDKTERYIEGRLISRRMICYRMDGDPKTKVDRRKCIKTQHIHEQSSPQEETNDAPYCPR